MSKVAVITGAGAGVGRATAEEFAKQGYDVALLSREPARLERAASELRTHGVRALPIPTDMADAKAVEAAADKTESELGPRPASSRSFIRRPSASSLETKMLSNIGV